jgi:catechol 2,3-dioxygenase-like lactoylglutathione lyase family enzyme
MQIESISLTTSRLAAQRRFYTEQIGLPLIEDHPQRFAVQIGRSMLHYAEVTHAPPIAHMAFTIPSAQYQEAIEWLGARAPALAAPDGRTQFHFQNWGADAIYFLDADGNILELIARHELPDPPVRPFGVGSLLCISEIGVVLDDVISFAQEAQRLLGVDVYRGNLDPEFTAVGSASGLFIMTRRGRPWMPDHTSPASDPPITVVGRTPAGAQFTVSGPPYRIEEPRAA